MLGSVVAPARRSLQTLLAGTNRSLQGNGVWSFRNGEERDSSRIDASEGNQNTYLGGIHDTEIPGGLSPASGIFQH
jgi:hypothetical protein